MKQDGTRLENETPREIMNMDRKTALKVMLEVLKLNGVSTLLE